MKTMRKVLTLVLVAMTVACAFVVPTSAKGQTREVPKATAAPKIDGTISSNEYKNALTIDLSGSAMQVSTDGGQTFHQGSASQLSGSKAYMMWDNNYVYVAAHVNDTTRPGTTGVSGANIVLSDSFHLAFYDKGFSTTNPMFTPAWLAIAPNGGNASNVYEYHNLKKDMTSVKSAVKMDSNGTGYTVEMAIPKSFFSNDLVSCGYAGMDLKANESIKINIMITDFNGSTFSTYTDTKFCVSAESNIYVLSNKTAGNGSTGTTSTTPITTAPVTTTPTTTKTPDSSNAPTTSNTPGSSETPATSDETPATSDETPGSDTSAPDTTGSAADTTKAPDTTKAAGTETESKSNVGMIVGIVAAVAVVAAIVIVIVVKKKKS